MPPRSTAIVTCSCGWYAGNSARADGDEDMADVGRGWLTGQVPRMVRHWELGHTVTLHDSRFEGTITRAAQKLAEREGVTNAD